MVCQKCLQIGEDVVQTCVFAEIARRSSILAKHSCARSSHSHCKCW